MSLQKAKLKALEGGNDIEFMFNPNTLSFSRSISLEQSAGARTEQEGINKTSFKHPNPYTLNISNILIDTYETGQSALDYVNNFKQAVEFGVEKNGVKRPPLYLFMWGDQNYLKCFVKSLKYKLTQFKPNGTPVRAFIDLTLEQIDLSNQKGPGNTPDVSQEQRQSNSR